MEVGAIITDEPWTYKDVMDSENDVMIASVPKKHLHMIKEDYLDRLLYPHEAIEIRDYVDAEIQASIKLETFQ
jgi:hypothetical protein